MDALSISVTCLVILVIVFFLLIPKLRYKLSVRDGIRCYFNNRYQLFVFAHSRFGKVREGKQVYERYRDFVKALYNKDNFDKAKSEHQNNQTRINLSFLADVVDDEQFVRRYFSGDSLSYARFLEMEEEWETRPVETEQPLLNVTISNRFLLITLLTVLLSGAVGGLIFINSPMYLAHQIYLQSTFRDISDNSYYYDDAYTKVCNGERQEIKRIIKKSKSETKSFKAVEALLVPLINEDIFVRKIQYGHNADTLVHYRHRGDNILWSAYFTSDGSVNVTSSQEIEFPMDAEKSLNSMRVKWKELR